MQRRAVLQLAGAAGIAAGASLYGSTAAAAASRSPGGKLTSRDGVGLHYSDWGTGKPLVFVHAWALASDQWDYQIAPMIAAGRRCVVYDRRGHGRSDVPGWGYDYDTLAEDLATVLEVLDLRQVTLVGHSMGAGEVIRYLTRNGTGRVERVVLLSPTTPGVKRSAANPNGLDPKIFETIRAAWQQDFPHWIDQNTDAFVCRGYLARHETLALADDDPDPPFGRSRNQPSVRGHGFPRRAAATEASGSGDSRRSRYVRPAFPHGQTDRRSDPWSSP
jgi:non-heme chloroperoxidase